MSSFHQAIEIGPKDRARFQKVLANVDPSNLYTVMPAPFLTMLGIEPEWQQTFEAPDGDRQEHSMAEIRVKMAQGERTTVCVFGRPDSEPTLGTHPLDAFGLEADLENNEIVELRLIVDGP